MPAPGDPESVPRPGLVVATPQVVPRALLSPVMSPKTVSDSADNVRTSSKALVFLTSTLYLTVAQAAMLPTKPLVTVPVAGTSVDLTETLLDEVGPKSRLVLRSAWPDTFA